MSPFQQAVTDIAKREAAKEADIYDQRLKAQAAGTGGFGGSRQAILEAQAAADLGARLSDIQTKGSQAAYQDAVRAAEAQRARQAAGAQAAGGLSQLYGGLGQQALGQAYREAGYLSGIGEAQRGLQQQRADLAYQEFMKQQQYPQQQLQQFSSLVQGFPLAVPAFQPQPSTFQQFVGGATALGGLGRGLGFFNQGGGISSVGLQRGGALPDLSLEPGSSGFSQRMKALRTNIAASKNPEEKEELQKRLDRMIAVSRAMPVKSQSKIKETGGIFAGTSPNSVNAAVAPTTPATTTPATTTPATTTPATTTPSTPDDASNKSTKKDTKSELQKLLEDAYKFDREGKEKAIKQQRGFDIAALGLEIMSKPLSQVNPAAIRQLGISQKELAGLDEAEAKAKIESKIKGLQIKKLEKELTGSGAVKLPSVAVLKQN